MPPFMKVVNILNYLSVLLKFGFIKQVDKGCIATMKDLES